MLPHTIPDSLGLLAEHLEAFCRERPDGTFETTVPGLYYTKFDVLSTPPRRLTSALTCLIVQGNESLYVGTSALQCPTCSSVIVAQKSPLLRQVAPTADGRPYIAMTIVLDPAEILSLIQEVNPISAPSGPTFGAVANTAPSDLIDAFARLAKLAGKAEDIPVLAPLVRREIFYRLLTGEHGRYLRDLVSHNRQFQKITAGMEWLRQNWDRQVSMQELARYTGMSLSTMHQSFREFTRMTPLDFHKQLRLQRARTLLLVENTDVAIVSRKVGYKSVSQFSREYRRLFQCSPGQETKRDHDHSASHSTAVIR